MWFSSTEMWLRQFLPAVYLVQLSQFFFFPLSCPEPQSPLERLTEAQRDMLNLGLGKKKQHLWIRSMWGKTSMSKHYHASLHRATLPFSVRLLMHCRNHAWGNIKSKLKSTVLLQALHPPLGLSKGRIRSQKQQYMLHILPSQLRYYLTHLIDPLS